MLKPDICQRDIQKENRGELQRVPDRLPNRDSKGYVKDIRYKVIDVSLMVGYTDSKYFSRLFKKKVGVNPNGLQKACIMYGFGQCFVY